MSFCIIPNTEDKTSQETQGLMYPPGLGQEVHGLEPRRTEKTGSSCRFHKQAIPPLPQQSEDDQRLHAGTWDEKGKSIVHTFMDDEDLSHANKTDPTPTESGQTAESPEQLKNERTAIRRKKVSFLKRRTQERLAANQLKECPAFAPEAIAPGLQTRWKQYLAGREKDSVGDKMEKGKGKQPQTTTSTSTPFSSNDPNRQRWNEYLAWHSRHGINAPDWLDSLDNKPIYPPWDNVWTPLIPPSSSQLSEDSASWSNRTNRSSATPESMIVVPGKAEV